MLFNQTIVSKYCTFCTKTLTCGCSQGGRWTLLLTPLCGQREVVAYGRSQIQ